MSSEYTSNATTAGVNYTVSSLSERPDLTDEHQTTGGSAWPEFMIHDPVAIANWDKMMSYFAGDQLSMLVEGQIAAVINMVPIRVETDLIQLPDRGVDWGVEKSVEDHENSTPPNAMMGLQVVIGKNFRGQRLSEIATQEMIVHARKRNCDFVLLPVRPNGKHAYPLIPMDQYINWERADGQPFDNWLRIHKRLGGKTIKVCHQSMIIPGTIAEWESWTGQKFPGSGQYIVPFALNPIDIDVDQNTGRYVEPNVWVAHRTG
ncbi:hypothetical protein [Roseovarius aestuarii]|uniref:N-acetyltransferase domain-containing protein n=1 Tax=Roseovarius aestuarii TaxID=475083 RepID=A0A1X7BW18_9RHOB|nr:hypothetical protein [Roseovarius aestuarii]SMC13794.1 hypothetical protein ROA7745_03654 [Roseovarius aestuarii]